MPGLDLSTLTAPELRQLLRLARGRRDGLLIDRVEWEIAQRTALESRIGVDLKRKAPIVIEDGDVTIDEVRAFRRPEPGLPPRPRRQGGGRVAAMLGGLVAGSALTAGAFAAAGTTGWTLPARIEIPALPVITVADRSPAPPPAPIRPVQTASSDAVAGLLAPEPFPERAPPPAPVEVAQAPEPVAAPPPPPEAEPPKPEKADKPKPAKTELAKKKPDTKEKSAVAAKKDGKAKTAVAAKKKTDAKAKTALAEKKTPADKAKLAKGDSKTKVAKKTDAKKADTKSAKTKLAAKDKPKAKATETKTAKAKTTPKSTASAKAKASAKPAAKTVVAKAAPKPAPAKPKVQAAATGEARDTIGALIAQAQGGAPSP